MWGVLCRIRMEAWPIGSSCGCRLPAPLKVSMQNLSSQLPTFDSNFDPNAGERWWTSTYFRWLKWAISSPFMYVPERCWTNGSRLHNRRVLVRFLSHPPLQLWIHGDCSSVSSAQCVCIDPYLTRISYHQEHHRSSMSTACWVMDFLAQHWVPVA